jgi:PhnB protein
MSGKAAFDRRIFETDHHIHTMTTQIATTTLVQPYLFFGGRCEEALEFYTRTIGAEVEMIMRHNESPEPPPPGMLAQGWENKIMHASFRVGESTLMGSDGCSANEGNFNGFMLSLSVPTEREADRVFAALAEGGTVKMPLTKTFWSPSFGMLTDRFGLGWMVTVPA